MEVVIDTKNDRLIIDAGLHSEVIINYDPFMYFHLDKVKELIGEISSRIDGESIRIVEL